MAVTVHGFARITARNVATERSEGREDLNVTTTLSLSLPSLRYAPFRAVVENGTVNANRERVQMALGFHTTHWSVVLAAKGDDTLARSALKTLCETYHIPVRRFIEREVAGDPSHRYGGRDADDLTQDFIAWLLEGEMFPRLQRDRAKFRTYLLGAVKHFLSKTRERESAAKRGGGRKPVSLTTDHASETSVTCGNEAFFDRDWAHSCVERAIATLGDSDETNVLLPWLTAELSATDRAELAERLGKSDAATKVALHRLRKRFREAIRQHIAQTVESPDDLNTELEYLIRALRSERR